ncbi:MAG: hypothetical protein ABR587_10215 [Candidatus Binatia bacterium]
MTKFSTVFAGLALAATFVLFGSATSAQAQSCGNGNVQEEAGEVCDNGGANNTQDVGCCAAGCEAFVAVDTLCRAASGVCDTVAEACTGSSAACPADVLSSTDVVCRPSLAGVCDSPETCTGTSDACPSDTFAPSDTPCRLSAGVCDLEETCTGSSGSCPSDLKSSAVCRVDAGVCDIGAETCDGINDDCPADVAADTTAVCRQAVGDCDAVENCDGVSAECPEDEKLTGLCRASQGECDIAESCNGVVNSCPADEKSDAVCRPAVNELCDIAESCDGGNVCPEDELVNCEDDDAVSCTEATCDPTEGCIIADNCVEICRSPGYWQTHSGSEKDGENVGQAVLDEVGSLIVCGEEISTTTELGTLDSSLEGLCVRTQGVHQRQLYRQLVAAALNCAISEGGDCDDVVEGLIDVTFSDCDALCAGDPVVDGPTLGECVEQLGCFNGGGRIVDGECAKGTCEGDGVTYCGADFDGCPDEQDCVRFEDSCAGEAICSEDLDAPAQICPKPGRASSPKTCKEARHNECTIDDCPEPVTGSCEGQCGGSSGDCFCDPLSCDIGDGCPDRDIFCNVCD